MATIMTNGVNWEYFDKFEAITNKYLPDMGEGDNMATQAVTALCKLIYKWYNDGDVFDNTYFLLGWANDLSNEANWLCQNTPISVELDRITDARTEGDYEQILKSCADKIFSEELLSELAKKEAVGSIYDCAGPYNYEEPCEEEEEYDEEDY